MKRWPYLYELSSQGEFASVDYFFADALLDKQASEEEATLLFALLASARRGDLCLTVEENLTQESKFLSLLAKAARAFSPSSDSPIVREANRFYLRKNWDFEKKVEQALSLLLPTVPFPLLSVDQMKQYNQEQQRAIQTAISTPFSFVIGGPGTGKTFTAAGIIQEFSRRFLLEKGREPLVFLMAPTGKAALHLYTQICKYTSLKPHFGTIHSFLYRKNGKEQKLRADLTIVDEGSMIDAKVLGDLLSAFDQNHTLVILGDQNQLPPVETGSLFADLIRTIEARSIPIVTKLETSMRSDVKELLSFARAISLGDQITVHNFLPSFLSPISLDENRKEETYRSLLGEIDPFLLSPGDSSSDEELLRKSERFALLSCVNGGPFGVDALNQICFAHSEKKRKEGELWPIPLLITKTDYRLGLFNGEKGVLLRSSSREQDVVLFPAVEEGGAVRRIPASLIRHFQWAYALSVHKSQGSEYQKVFLLLPKGSESFGREALYTGITRARSRVFIAAMDGVLDAMLAISGQKLSGIGCSI